MGFWYGKLVGLYFLNSIFGRICGREKEREKKRIRIRKGRIKGEKNDRRKTNFSLLVIMTK